VTLAFVHEEPQVYAVHGVNLSADSSWRCRRA